MSYTYEQVIKAVIEDFENLFSPDSGFKVNYKVESGNFLAKVSGNSKGDTLLFSKLLANQEVNSIDDIMFCLIIVGHELAHYVNRHNSHADESKLDSVAIEAWADFFGARIMFTLITHGALLQKKIANIMAIPFAKPMPVGPRQDLLLKACGRALLNAYESLYKQSDGNTKYPKSSIRVRTFVAGISSFFFRLFGSMREDWTIYVYKLVFLDTNLASITHDFTIYEEPDSLIERTLEIHKKIKGDEQFISLGLKQNYLDLVGTNYVDNKEERNRLMVNFRDEFKKWKLPIEI